MKHTLLIIEEPGFDLDYYDYFKKGMNLALKISKPADLIEIIYRKAPNAIHPLWELSMKYIAETNSDNISISEYETHINTLWPPWALDDKDHELIKKSNQMLAFWCGEDDYVSNMIMLAEDYEVPTTIFEL